MRRERWGSEGKGGEEEERWRSERERGGEVRRDSEMGEVGK